MSKIRGLLAKNEHFEANNKIVSEIIAQLCLENSIQTLLNFLGSTPPKILEWFVWSHRLGVGDNFPAGNQAQIFSLQLTFCLLINMARMRDSR